MGETFNHKVLCCWINDVSTLPRRGKRWPIIDIDESLLQDYEDLFRVMGQWGYNEIVIWGLFINHAWSPNLPDSIAPDRERAVRRILDSAHRHGVRVMSGLGIYSWGFEEIIRQNPGVVKQSGRVDRGRFFEDNRVVMCYELDEAREWQRKVIDYMMSFDLDGFQMQSADQGRCACESCRRMSDIEYHAAVNDEFATYIKSRWPNKVVAVSGWGITFDDVANMPHYTKLGSHLDYMTDIEDKTVIGKGVRKRIIEEVACDFGNTGGPVVTQPQRWGRNRWFLPHADLTGSIIQSLAADGGRALEFFGGPLVNPGHDIMTKFTGALLSDVSRTINEALTIVVEDVFVPRTSGVKDELVRLLLTTENSYFQRVDPILEALNFEPLMGAEEGPPIYLERIPAEQIDDFRRELYGLQAEFSRLRGEVHHPRVIQDIAQCLEEVAKDVKAVQSSVEIV